MDDLLKVQEVVQNYQHLTQCKEFGSRVEAGKYQLVRVSYDDKGKSTVEECSPWLPLAEWLKWMDDMICAS